MEFVQISIVYARPGTKCSQCVRPVSHPLSWVRSGQTCLCKSQTVSSPSSPVPVSSRAATVHATRITLLRVKCGCWGMLTDTGLHFARIQTTKAFTERVGMSVSLDLYSGSDRFVRISVRTLAILRSFVVLFSPSKKVGIVPRLDHDRFYLNRFHEISHHSKLYSRYWQRRQNKPQKNQQQN